MHACIAGFQLSLLAISAILAIAGAIARGGVPLVWTAGALTCVLACSPNLANRQELRAKNSLQENGAAPIGTCN